MKNKKKSNIVKSFKFFKEVKYQLIVIAIFNIALGVIGFISPIIEAKLVTSITNSMINQVILIALGFFVVVTVEDLLWHFGLTFWKKKIRNSGSS